MHQISKQQADEVIKGLQDAITTMLIARNEIIEWMKAHPNDPQVKSSQDVVDNLNNMIGKR